MHFTNCNTRNTRNTRDTRSKRSTPAPVSITLLAASLLAIWAPLASAQEAAPAKATISDCHRIEDAIKRLACYDVATNKEIPVKLDVQVVEAQTKDSDASGSTAPASGLTSSGLRLLASLQREAPGSKPSSWSERWDLDDQPDPALFALRPYKPMYILLANRTTSINTMPESPNPANQSNTPVGLQKTEAKFQISFKAKMLDDLFVKSGSLWFGYTQTSRWQIYNHKISAAFRENNFEPEAILTLPTNYSLFGWKGSMVGASLTHQSNGRALPVSRSWNRVIFEAAFEKDDWTVVLRPWVRLQEKSATDDNPDISNYIGRGELLLIRKMGSQQFALTARHTLKGGGDSRGSVALDWAFPLYGYLKGHVQLFTGYGESLIDYNHKQTTFGLGVSLLEWF